MDLNSIKPNSDEYLEKQEENKKLPDIKPAIKGSGKTGKRSPFRTFIEFASGEDIGSLRKRLMYKVALPWVFDSIHSGIEDINDAIFSGGSSGPRRSRKSSKEQTSYDEYYERKNGKRNKRRDDPSWRKRSGEYEDVWFDYKWQAQDVKDTITSYFDEFKVLTVSNLYRAANVVNDDDNYIDSTFTDDSYGWYSLKDVYIDKRGGKWYLIMPTPVPLNKN